MGNEFFTWTALATVAGATAATGLLTQLVKGLSPLAKVPARAISYVIALVLLAAATIITQGVDWTAIIIVPVNAAVVALAANGAYDGITGGKQ